jgi:hypothetical protein
VSTFAEVRTLVDSLPVGSFLHTLDPGLRSPALVTWRRDGLLPSDWRLVRAKRGRPKLGAGGDLLARAIELADDLVPMASPPGHHVLVSEAPESRAAGRSLNRPDQLHGMVALAAAVAVRLVGMNAPTRAASLTPTEWVGSVPKSETGDPRESVRGGRVWGLLDDEERALLTSLGLVQHDVFDAVGIGLVATGRARRGLVAPRRRSS